MHDSTAAGRMTEAKAEHLSFDILEQKKLKLEKIEKKKKKKRRKKLGSKVCPRNMIDRQWLLLGSLKYVDFFCDYIS